MGNEMNHEKDYVGNYNGSFKTCPVREHTADGFPVGRCWHTLSKGNCPIHGNVLELIIKWGTR